MRKQALLGIRNDLNPSSGVEMFYAKEALALYIFVSTKAGMGGQQWCNYCDSTIPSILALPTSASAESSTLASAIISARGGQFSSRHRGSVLVRQQPGHVSFSEWSQRSLPRSMREV